MYNIIEKRELIFFLIVIGKQNIKVDSDRYTTIFSLYY